MGFWLWWAGTGIVCALGSCLTYGGKMTKLDFLVCIVLGSIAGPIVWVIQGFWWVTDAPYPKWLENFLLKRRR